MTDKRECAKQAADRIVALSVLLSSDSERSNPTTGDTTGRSSSSNNSYNEQEPNQTEEVANIPNVCPSATLETSSESSRGKDDRANFSLVNFIELQSPSTITMHLPAEPMPSSTVNDLNGISLNDSQLKNVLNESEEKLINQQKKKIEKLKRDLLKVERDLARAERDLIAIERDALYRHLQQGTAARTEPSH